MTLRRLACLALVASAARGLACPQLPVAHDAPNPFELQLGATNVNAALGSGKLTAAFSRCGELTVLKWPVACQARCTQPGMPSTITPAPP